MSTTNTPFSAQASPAAPTSTTPSLSRSAIASALRQGNMSVAMLRDIATKLPEGIPSDGATAAVRRPILGTLLTIFAVDDEVIDNIRDLPKTLGTIVPGLVTNLTQFALKSAPLPASPANVSDASELHKAQIEYIARAQDRLTACEILFLISSSFQLAQAQVMELMNLLIAVIKEAAGSDLRSHRGGSDGGLTGSAAHILVGPAGRVVQLCSQTSVKVITLSLCRALTVSARLRDAAGRWPETKRMSTAKGNALLSSGKTVLDGLQKKLQELHDSYSVPNNDSSHRGRHDLPTTTVAAGSVLLLALGCALVESGSRDVGLDLCLDACSIPLHRRGGPVFSPYLGREDRSSLQNDESNLNSSTVTKTSNSGPRTKANAACPEFGDAVFYLGSWSLPSAEFLALSRTHYARASLELIRHLCGAALLPLTKHLADLDVVSFRVVYQQYIDATDTDFVKRDLHGGFPHQAKVGKPGIMVVPSPTFFFGQLLTSAAALFDELPRIAVVKDDPRFLRLCGVRAADVEDDLESLKSPAESFLHMCLFNGPRHIRQIFDLQPRQGNRWDPYSLHVVGCLLQILTRIAQTPGGADRIALLDSQAECPELQGDNILQQVRVCLAATSGMQQQHQMRTHEDQDSINYRGMRHRDGAQRLVLGDHAPTPEYALQQCDFFAESAIRLSTVLKRTYGRHWIAEEIGTDSPQKHNRQKWSLARAFSIDVLFDLLFYPHLTQPIVGAIFAALGASAICAADATAVKIRLVRAELLTPAWQQQQRLMTSNSESPQFDGFYGSGAGFEPVTRYGPTTERRRGVDLRAMIRHELSHGSYSITTGLCSLILALLQFPSGVGVMDIKYRSVTDAETFGANYDRQMLNVDQQRQSDVNLMDPSAIDWGALEYIRLIADEVCCGCCRRLNNTDPATTTSVNKRSPYVQQQLTPADSIYVVMSLALAVLERALSPDAWLNGSVPFDAAIRPASAPSDVIGEVIAVIRSASVDTASFAGIPQQDRNMDAPSLTLLLAASPLRSLAAVFSPSRLECVRNTLRLLNTALMSTTPGASSFTTRGRTADDSEFLATLLRLSLLPDVAISMLVFRHITNVTSPALSAATKLLASDLDCGRSVIRAVSSRLLPSARDHSETSPRVPDALGCLELTNEVLESAVIGEATATRCQEAVLDMALASAGYASPSLTTFLSGYPINDANIYMDSILAGAFEYSAAHASTGASSNH